MLKNEFIAKIEGHGSLNVDWQKNKVQLNIFEGERLFEGMLVGRPVEEAHWITSRICGVCPVAHNIASVRAGEAALGIVPNKTTELLRELILCGQNIQSHFLHLFFLALPDYIGIDRGTELAKKNPEAFKLALSLKEVSDEIVFLVGGRSVHPMTTTVGGFHKIPSKESLTKLLKKLKSTETAASKTIELFSALKYPELKVDLTFVAQEEEFIVSILSTEVFSGEIKKSLIKNYKKDFEEEIKNYSTAKFARYKKREVLTGSLARLAVSKNRKEYKGKIDFENPFFNNLAQAFEILIYRQKAEAIIEKLLKSRLDATIIKPALNPPLKGIGTVEAPRGGLYHEIHIRPRKGERANKNSPIVYANIITPTVQNLTSIEKSAQVLLDKTLHQSKLGTEQTKNRSRNERERLLKMLVRAYDPCITCAVH